MMTRLRNTLKLIREDFNAHTAKGTKDIFRFAIWNPSFRLMLNYRLGAFCESSGLSFLSSFLRFRQVRLFGCHIAFSCKIGRRVKFPHPTMVVIGQGAVVGDDVRIWQGVTLGGHGKKGLPWVYPTIGNRVRIYSGASVLGEVLVGDEAVIGAASLVLKDVPAGSTVAGAPARVIRQPEAERL